jgi:hypothetical protein
MRRQRRTPSIYQHGHLRFNHSCAQLRVAVAAAALFEELIGENDDEDDEGSGCCLTLQMHAQALAFRPWCQQA